EVLGDERGRLISLRYYWRSGNTLRPITPEDLENPPFRHGVLVLLSYPGWVTEEQRLMTELLKRGKERGTLHLLDREGGVFLFLLREGR
ncbi:MAG: hypothetical protein P3W93_009775, partial [Thermus sp.]|nr:hypothetical protein [Thermus sp.]